MADEWVESSDPPPRECVRCNEPSEGERRCPRCGVYLHSDGSVDFEAQEYYFGTTDLSPAVPDPVLAGLAPLADEQPWGWNTDPASELSERYWAGRWTGYVREGGPTSRGTEDLDADLESREAVLGAPDSARSMSRFQQAGLAAGLLGLLAAFVGFASLSRSPVVRNGSPLGAFAANRGFEGTDGKPFRMIDCPNREPVAGLRVHCNVQEHNGAGATYVFYVTGAPGGLTNHMDYVRDSEPTYYVDLRSRRPQALAISLGLLVAAAGFAVWPVSPWLRTRGGKKALHTTGKVLGVAGSLVAGAAAVTAASNTERLRNGLGPKGVSRSDAVVGDGGNVTIYRRRDGSFYGLDAQGRGAEGHSRAFGPAKFDARPQYARAVGQRY